MNRISTSTACCLVFIFVSLARGEVAFDWAIVGNPGNARDSVVRNLGRVDYTYRISKHEVTNAQYVEFLNAVAATDPNGLFNLDMDAATWGGIRRHGVIGNYTYTVKPPAMGEGPNGTDYIYDNKPVNYVSYFDAMRFVNWLHNGQGAGGTEFGVYEITDGISETRSFNAEYWIPNHDEWYKAAYYDPTSATYYLYPTSTDRRPGNGLPDDDTGNSVNYYVHDFFNPSNSYTTGNRPYPMTDVGAYALSTSPYGTYDQGGNVREWLEDVSISGKHWFRGGSAGDSLTFLASDGNLLLDPPGAEGWPVGFHVASRIPEPSTIALATLVSLTAMAWRFKRPSLDPAK